MSTAMETSGMTAETEVVTKARRRRFTAAEKLRVLREADGCSKPGELGALLRREGLYSSHLSVWRAALEVAGASYYRGLKPQVELPPRPTPARALPAEERQAVLEVLHEPRFVDLSPAEVYATLLDDDRYLCSERTMYRVLDESQEVRERRNQLRHPHYAAPQLLATRPKELWSWDITKRLGPTKWTYYYLYVLLDVFSRYVVGWMLAHRELARLAEKLIDESCERQKILPGQLTVHADRGTAMTSKPVALLLADLGVTKSHSRPHVSNDNPFSESQFKTMKYRPDFPERVGSLEDGR